MTLCIPVVASGSADRKYSHILRPTSRINSSEVVMVTYSLREHLVSHLCIATRAWLSQMCIYISTTRYFW